MTLIRDDLVRVASRFAHGFRQKESGWYGGIPGALERDRASRSDVDSALLRVQQIEAALRDSQASLSLALDLAGMGTWTCDVETGAITWSQQIGPLYGLARGATIAHVMEFLKLVHPDDREAVNRAFQDTRNGAQYEIEFRTIWPDGTVHWIHAKGGPIPSSGGQRVCGVAQDVTTQKTRERVIRESESRFRVMADSSPVITWVANADGGIEFVNRAAQEFVGVSEGDWRGFVWRSLVHPDDADAFATGFVNAAREGLQFCAGARFRRADGEWRHLLTYALPRLSGDGRVLGLVGSSPDVTHIHAASEQLRETMRLKDEFLATIAHELRQPVHAAAAAMQVLALQVPDSTAATKPLGVARRQLQQMSMVISDLLESSRIVRGSIPLQKQSADLRDVIHAAVETTSSLVTQRNHQLILALPSEPLPIEIDAPRIQQVITNLVSNAAKYTADGGEIRVCLETERATAIVRVVDNGRGIPRDALDRIFDVFVRLGGEAEHGFGIGLSVARKLVEQHGGTIEACSAGPGHGSEFIVRLPVSR